ncbi:unnamed protein product, partial [Didymodactylos carnosus]
MRSEKFDHALTVVDGGLGLPWMSSITASFRSAS